MLGKIEGRRRREWQTTSAFLPCERHEQYEKAKRYDTTDTMYKIDN